MNNNRRFVVEVDNNDVLNLVQNFLRKNDINFYQLSDTAEDDKRLIGKNFKNYFLNSFEGIYRIEFTNQIATGLPTEKQIELFNEYSFFADCNDTMAKMYGLENAEKVIGKKLKDFLPVRNSESDSLKKFIENNYKISNYLSIEYDNKGEIKYFLNNTEGIIEYGILTSVLGTQQDITSLKKAEEALIEKEELYRTVIESLVEGLIITDINDKILFVNKALLNLTGYSEKELLNKIGYKIFFNEDQWDFILKKNILRFSDITDSYEIEMYNKNRQKIFVSIKGAPFRNSKGEIIGTIGLVNDITYQKVSSKIIKESETKYRSVVNEVREVIIQTDEQGEIIFLNPFWTEMTGYTIEESLNKNFTEFLHPDDRKKILNQFISLVYKKKDYIRNEARCITKEKGFKWIEVNFRLIFNESEEIVGTSGTISDLHERKLAEEELIKAKEKAEESDHLKSIFLAQMSHEIRTPLNIVLSYCSLIEDELEKKYDNEYDEAFKAIKNGGKRLLRTIDSILNMSLLQSGEYKTNIVKIDLELLLYKIISDFKSAAAEKNLKLEFNNTALASVINADEYTINHAFENLLDNAIKYTDQGGINILMKDKNDLLVVDVIDTGIGISEEFLSKIFNPFSQEEIGYSRKFEGNGLGLALTKKYLELNKASIEVMSKKGEGTIVSVSFKKLK